MSAFLKAGVAVLPPLPDTLEEFDINIVVDDGWLSRTKIVRPRASVSAKRPLIVDFYGGGFMVGEPEQLLNVARAFAETYGAVVALPSYRLVPDVKWPRPHKDGWDVVSWLSQNAETELGADLDAGFIVGGVSAGASVAVAIGGLSMFPDSKEARAVSQLAKSLTGQFLRVPFAVVEETVPLEYRSLFTAWEDNKDAQGLNAGALQMVLKGLQCTDYTSLWISPVSELGKREPVNKFPIYMEQCQFDALRDDVTVYKKVLESRSIPVKTHLFPEDGHMAWTVGDQPRKAKNPTFEEANLEGMKWLLSKP